MWRKLLLVALLLGIGYVIWRRMQRDQTLSPVSDLSPAPSAAPSAPSTPSAPSPSPAPSAPSAPASTSSGPRPIVTRVHRGAPPTIRRSSASAEAAASDCNGVTDVDSASDTVQSAAPVTHVSTGDADTSSQVASASATTAGMVAEKPESSSDVQVAESGEVESPVAETGREEEKEEVSAEGTELAPVDINRADRETLIALPGIGPVLADRIIAYREAHGPFKSVDDLTAISGIGERNINIFRKLVYVDPNA
ncbi:ComEA family DNA-binding protein [Chloroflexus sp.]|uniref:ComEA family DNA-binding protein n=1 Tax=Chloroflexus sp. TaxID=1904827 RepID=UPI002ADE7826|nr:ComEA family DNA-binding protein [Chloroflexus sp.]